VQEAARREVLEESGLTFDPTALIYVEAPGHYWIRFTLTGTVTGRARYFYLTPASNSLLSAVAVWQA